MRPRLYLLAFALGIAPRPTNAHDPGFGTVGAREIEAMVIHASSELADHTVPPAFLINDTTAEAPQRERQGEDDIPVFPMKTLRPADHEEKTVLMNRFLHCGDLVATLALDPSPKKQPRTIKLLPMVESAALAIVALIFFYAFRRPLRFRSKSPPIP